MLQDILEKQATEQRRTSQFLKFALGKREEKSQNELMKDLKDKKYNPKNDKFMPRLFRKIGHQNGERSTGQSNMSRDSRNLNSAGWTPQVSQYDNNMSLSNTGKGQKYTLV